MRFEIVRNSQGQYYWHMRAANGQIIAYSGETYVAKTSCRHALDLVRTGSASAPVVDLT
jgi:uncharacterized protein